MSKQLCRETVFIEVVTSASSSIPVEYMLAVDLPPMSQPGPSVAYSGICVHFRPRAGTSPGSGADEYNIPPGVRCQLLKY